MNKNVSWLIVLSAIVLLPRAPAIADPIGTAFTYQGELEQGGTAVDAMCNFQFSLWDDPDSLNPADQVGLTLLQTLDVMDGRLTTTLDFGADIFTGDARWLQIAVCCPSPCGGVTTLVPRQELTPAPYSIRAASGVGPPDTIEIDAATGNVGIGTSNPAALLNISSSAGESKALFVEHTAHTNDFAVLWLRGDSDGDAGGGFLDTVFTAAGNVGIGTALPSAKLHVAGTAGTDGIKFPDGTLQKTAAGSSIGFVSASGAAPTGTIQFLAPAATVTIAAGQRIHVTSDKALGAYAGGASGLNLWIGYRVSGSGAVPSTWGGGSFGMQVPANTRVLFGLSAIITGLAPGTYEVGLVGSDVSGDNGVDWANNEYGYTSAFAF